jgi:hypothetical protein
VVYRGGDAELVFGLVFGLLFISFCIFFSQRRLLSRGRDAELVFEDMMREARRIFEQAAAVGDRLPYTDTVKGLGFRV